MAAENSGKNKKKSGDEVLATNPLARMQFELFERFEAGLVLLGTEVKAAREGQVSLREAFITLRGEEAFLIGCHIAPYRNAGYASHDPLRERKLLLHKGELRKLHGKLTLRGFTLVPLRIYTVRGKLKIEIALAQGKKLHDKRETIRDREVSREIRRELKAG